MPAADAERLVSLTLDDDGIAFIRMQDERGGNALSEAMATALRAVLAEVSASDRARVVILAGVGAYFSTGASAEVLAGLAAKSIVPSELDLPAAILGLPVPAIAAMEGHAIGGGLALGVCADMVLAARESRYGCTFMNLGFTPGMGTTRLLEHAMTPSIAHEMLYTGQYFTGRELAGRTSINYVLPRAEVLPKAWDLARRIAEKPRVALVALKATLAQERTAIYRAAFASEIAMHNVSFGQPEIAESLRRNLRGSGE